MEATMTSIGGGINTTAGPCFYPGQEYARFPKGVLDPRQVSSFEELKQLLVCASLELKSQREATKAQEQLHEARVRHLEELLKTARRERDEFREQCIQLKGRISSTARIMGSGLSQETQLRNRSGLQPLESVASMPEPSRVTHTDGPRKTQPKYVSTMAEPTRDTLAEVHRKLQHQHQQQQQLELQQLDMQQLHHHMDLQHQHGNHSQLDLRQSPAASHGDFQSHQHQLEEFPQHFEIEPKDHLQGQPQLHMDMVMTERKSEVSHSGEVDNGSEEKSATWTEYPGNGHMEIHSSNGECLILESPEQLHINELTQGMPTPHVEQRSSPHLDDIQQQLQQQQHQHQQDDNMQIHLQQQQQQESEEILSHMHQGQTADAHAQALHLQGEQKLRRQLSKRKLEGLGTPVSGGGLQGTTDVVMNIPVLQQQQLNVPWSGGLISLTSSAPLSNGPNGMSEQLMPNSCLQGGSVVASILSPLERFGDPTSSSMLLPRPIHLPEPPEADPQVLLKLLPEKGKLLQAMLQTGPLLKTLLLSGPLPQWRHPPPPLDPEEIPRVSMGATVGILPPGEQGIGGLMPSHGSANSMEQGIRLSAPLQSSPSQNGFCH